MVAVGDGLPALGIVAAVLGVVKAMGALDQSPEILGGLIGAALVGTFLGIFLSYAVVGPIATKIKTVREKKNRLYIIVKQTLLAYMNGSLPQVAIEFGRKTISAYDRPSIDAVEQSTMSTGAPRKRRRPDDDMRGQSRRACAPRSSSAWSATIGEPDHVKGAARAAGRARVAGDRRRTGGEAAAHLTIELKSVEIVAARRREADRRGLRHGDRGLGLLVGCAEPFHGSGKPSRSSSARCSAAIPTCRQHRSSARCRRPKRKWRPWCSRRSPRR